MEDLKYYKSLISDEEVIKALVKESKAREGEFEKVRVRPNMNFFQRTVSNMVSSNRRIATKQERFTAKQHLRNSKYRKQDVKGCRNNTHTFKESYKCTDISNKVDKQDRYFVTSKKNEKIEKNTYKNCSKQENHLHSIRDVEQVDISESVLCLSDDNAHNSIIIIDSDDNLTNKETLNNEEFLKRKRRLLKKRRKQLEHTLKSYGSKKKNKS